MFSLNKSPSPWFWIVGLIWFVSTAIPLGYMVGFHLNFLPSPTSNGLAQLALTYGRNKWPMEMIHFIGADCRCSERIASYLIQRKPYTIDTGERVVVVGENSKLVSQLESSGFHVTTLNGEVAASQYSLKGLPMLLILGSKGQIAYSGGYTSHRTLASTSAYQDLTILESVRNSDKQVPSLPIWGCANGKTLRNSLDPLGLKYER
jgi:hypothetical protein